MLLITGASGRIARRTAELLAQKEISLRLMSRTPDRVPRFPRSEVVEGDFADPISLAAAFRGATFAFVISGSGKPGERARLHRNAFEAAARAGVQHVIYLSLQGAAPTSKYPLSRDHYLSEQYLAETGVAHTVLRNAFYIDMFLERFDPDGVVRGPAGETKGAFVAREDAARTAAAVLLDPPGGDLDVTGPEALSVREVASRLSVMVGRDLRYEEESAECARERLSKTESEPWRIALAVGWFEAIRAGELEHTSDTVSRSTGAPPMNLETYFRLFPGLLKPLRRRH